MMALPHYASLYWLFFKNRMKILMEYRVNFLIGAVSTIVMQAAGLLTIWVSGYRRVPEPPARMMPLVMLMRSVRPVIGRECRTGDRRPVVPAARDPARSDQAAVPSRSPR